MVKAAIVGYTVFITCSKNSEFSLLLRFIVSSSGSKLLTVVVGWEEVLSLESGACLCRLSWVIFFSICAILLLVFATSIAIFLLISSNSSITLELADALMVDTLTGEKRGGEGLGETAGSRECRQTVERRIQMTKRFTVKSP